MARRSRSSTGEAVALFIAERCMEQTRRRSEVVGRPLAALLANDGARVFSVDIDSIQACIHHFVCQSGLIDGPI